MAATTDGVSWVEREVTRKGKTYKQWFRVKSGGTAAAPPPAAKAATAPVAPKAPKGPKAEAKPKSAAERLMGAKSSSAPGKAKPVNAKQLAGNADAALKQAGRDQGQSHQGLEGWVGNVVHRQADSADGKPGLQRSCAKEG